ncbi:MAG TPA: cytidylate kinase family protein [Armatimonadota bacterium]|nr:cytidylate kinase family protein [Armatimonadota bacterium]
MSRCIVAISGDLGSGKSTVARLVAAELDMKVYSTGDMQRALAAELGMTSLELNKLAETDPSIDERIDGSTVQIARDGDRVLFDSRLAWHFVPDSFKVFLTVDPRLGVERIFSAGRGHVEQYGSMEEAAVKINERRASENKRYAELYGVSPERLENYDVVIDTSQAGPETVAGLLSQAAGAWMARRAFPKIWLSPRTPFPTRSIHDGAIEQPRWDIPGAVSRDGLQPDPDCPPVRLARVGRYYYLCDGRQAASTLITAGVPFMPGIVEMADEDPAPGGGTAASFVAREATAERAHAWEEAHQFRYPSYPPHFDRDAQPYPKSPPR